MARPPHIDCDQMSDDVREDLFMPHTTGSLTTHSRPSFACGYDAVLVLGGLCGLFWFRWADSRFAAMNAGRRSERLAIAPAVGRWINAV
jgi:hypothetical protein